MKLKEYSDNSTFRLSANTVYTHIHMNHRKNKLANEIQERIQSADKMDTLFGRDIELTKKEMISVFGKEFELSS